MAVEDDESGALDESLRRKRLHLDYQVLAVVKFQQFRHEGCACCTVREPKLASK